MDNRYYLIPFSLSDAFFKGLTPFGVNLNERQMWDCEMLK